MSEHRKSTLNIPGTYIHVKRSLRTQKIIIIILFAFTFTWCTAVLLYSNILTLLILITLYISKKIPAHTRATQDPGTFTQIFFILWTMVILRAMDCQCCQDRNDVWRVCLFHYYCPRAPLSFSDRIQWLVQYF